MHSDVELIVGNFVWSGMFDTLTVSQNADEPFLMSFSISFVAWKERFRSNSPYHNQIMTDIERGHSYGSWLSSADKALDGIPANSRSPLTLPPLLPPAPSPLPATGTPLPASTPITSAAQQSANNNTILAQTTDTAYQDWTPSPFTQSFNNTLTGAQDG